MYEKHCSIPDCKNQDFSIWCYDGRHYCQQHYDSIFLQNLNALYRAWDGVTEPPRRLVYLVGRYFSEHEHPLIGEPGLTSAIIRDRSYNWSKTEDGVVFTAVRYPVNREYCGPCRRFGEPLFDEVHQTWKFNVRSLEFTFLNEEVIESCM